MSTDPRAITSGVLRDWPLPESGSDKDSQGRVLVVGGSVPMPGAVLLPAEAALRAGAGKLQIATVEPLAVPLGLRVPEGYVASLPHDDGGNISPAAAEQIIDLANGCSAVLLGPGIMSPEAATALLEQVVPQLDVPVVIDALGMAYLTKHRDGVAHLNGRAILSPNLTELAATLEVEVDQVGDDPLGHVRELATSAGAVVVSGGAATYVVDPSGRAWRDESGGEGMAVSGSGDVKAGLLAGLLGRGAEPAQAAAWGSYVHGRAGERLVAVHGRRGYLARELLTEIPRCLAELDG